jgi:hypothetical protein
MGILLWPSALFAQGIQHRMLLEDESRSKMHYVDTADPVKHWEIVFPARYRDYQLIFFAGFQVLKNGHLVVSNWTGHGANDSVKGHQVLEFDADGRLLWSWHDPALAGSIHGVIVLDDLDPSRLHDDICGMLGPVK